LKISATTEQDMSLTQLTEKFARVSRLAIFLLGAICQGLQMSNSICSTKQQNKQIAMLLSHRVKRKNY
jgi:hypothetical protein